MKTDGCFSAGTIKHFEIELRERERHEKSYGERGKGLSVAEGKRGGETLKRLNKEAKERKDE